MSADTRIGLLEQVIRRLLDSIALDAQVRDELVGILNTETPGRGRPAKLEPCKQCGELLTARQRKAKTHTCPDVQIPLARLTRPQLIAAIEQARAAGAGDYRTGRSWGKSGRTKLTERSTPRLLEMAERLGIESVSAPRAPAR